MPLTVTLKRGDAGPLKLEVVRTGTPGVIAELREIQAGEHYELIVGLEPPLKPGRLRSSVLLKTGIKEHPEANITVFADIPFSWAESEMMSAVQ